jgi:thiol-disulfide isomerase/thioredoxin
MLASVRRIVLWVGGALVVGALAVGVVVASGGSSGGPGVTQPTRFDLPRLDGTGRVQLAAFRGTPVVVDLFASWCTACRTELPSMAAVAKRAAGKVIFVGVDSVDSGRGAAMAREFGLASAGFVLARDVGGAQGSGLHDALNALGMPATAFYDATGKILFMANEAIPEATLVAKLRELYGITA